MVVSYPTNHYKCWIKSIIKRSSDSIFENEMIDTLLSSKTNKLSNLRQLKKNILYDTNSEKSV